ncbi:MAG: hypothetical protein RL065_1710 [Bacteroidota bacterium]
MKTILITQSNYIPWKGYFDAINSANEVMMLDDVQYTKRDWRNRNLIKTNNGVKWLTIPVLVKNKYHQLISDAVVADSNWAQKHWKIIKQNYSKASCFNEGKDVLEDLYLDEKQQFLTDINQKFITRINDFLKIKTKFVKVELSGFENDKTNKLVQICQQQKADKYLCGPASKQYLNEQKFNENKIEVQYLDYSGYSEYNQLHGKFIHEVSIIDLLFNEGSNAYKYLKSFAPK